MSWFTDKDGNSVTAPGTGPATTGTQVTIINNGQRTDATMQDGYAVPNKSW